jgi:hypothetical protein
VEGRSERRDSYPIVVTRSPEDTVERLPGTVLAIDGGELAG